MIVRTVTTLSLFDPILCHGLAWILTVIVGFFGCLLLLRVVARDLLLDAVEDTHFWNVYFSEFESLKCERSSYISLNVSGYRVCLHQPYIYVGSTFPKSEDAVCHLAAYICISDHL